MADASVDLVLTTADVEVRLMVKRPQDRAGARRAESVSSQVTPIRAGDQLAQAEALATYRDYSGGAGYGERLAENVYHYDAPGYSRSPYLAMPPGRLTEITPLPPMNGPIRGSFEARADLFFVGGNKAIRLALGSGAPFLSQDLGANFTAYSAINFGSQSDGYVGGTGGAIWRFRGDTGAWVQSSNVHRVFLESVYWVRGNIGKQRLVGSTPSTNSDVVYTWPDRSILYTDNDAPITENLWSEEIQIGNPAYSITALTASNQHLYVLKSNGLHDVDDRLYAPILTASHGAEPGFPRFATVFGKAIYFSTLRGLDRYGLETEGIRQDRHQRCSFGFGLPNYGPIHGEPTAGVNEDGWLATAYYDALSDTSYLCYGIDYGDIGLARPAIGGPLLWHGAEAILPGVKVTHLRPMTPQGTHAPVLYLGGYRQSTGLATLHTLSLPSTGSPITDHTEGGTMEFADAWVKYLPRETWGNDAARKDLTKISIRGQDLGTAVIDAYRAIEGDDFGADSLGQSTSDFEEFQVDTETSARDQTFKVAGTGNATTPAILKLLEARAGVSVEASDVVAYPFEFGFGVKQHSGEFRGDPFLVEEQLKSTLGKRATLVDNIRRRTYVVRVLQGLRIDWEEYPSGVRTGRATGVLPVQILDYVWNFDTGRHFDAGLRFA